MGITLSMQKAKHPTCKPNMQTYNGSSVQTHSILITNASLNTWPYTLCKINTQQQEHYNVRFKQTVIDGHYNNSDAPVPKTYPPLSPNYPSHFTLQNWAHPKPHIILTASVHNILGSIQNLRSRGGRVPTVPLDTSAATTINSTLKLWGKRLGEDLCT